MQRAAFRDPPAMFLSVPTNAFPVTVIEYGAGAACDNGGITAGVGDCRIHLSPRFPISPFRVIWFVESGSR